MTTTRHLSICHVVVLTTLFGAGCRNASTPVAPETPAVPSVPTVPSGPALTGTVVDGVSNLAVANATVRVDGAGEVTTAANGGFALGAPEPAATRAVTITSPSTTERAVWLTAPGSAGTLPLMPSSIALNDFNDMFRGNLGVLHRWTAAPRLLILKNTLVFTSISDATYTATSSVMADDDANLIVSDLTWALPQLTGNTFTSFDLPGTETAQEGDRVQIIRTGTIYVARYRGLRTGTGFWGYTRWSWSGAGDVVMGTMMLDEGFELADSSYRRSLRAHELGHALGYNHVLRRASVMNSLAQTEPTSFDRDGSRIAFLRPPLNRSPDADPNPATLMTLDVGRLFWAGAP